MLNYNVLDKYRYKKQPFASNDGDDFGLFFIPTTTNQVLNVLSSGYKNQEWYHVSVSLPNRCPTWDEMAKIKNLFFGEEITAIQFHPKKSEYINNHPYCLHLWWKVGTDYELPPSILTGVKTWQ